MACFLIYFRSLFRYHLLNGTFFDYLKVPQCFAFAPRLPLHSLTFLYSRYTRDTLFIFVVIGARTFVYFVHCCIPSAQHIDTKYLLIKKTQTYFIILIFLLFSLILYYFNFRELFFFLKKMSSKVHCSYFVIATSYISEDICSSAGFAQSPPRCFHVFMHMIILTFTLETFLRRFNLLTLNLLKILINHQKYNLYTIKFTCFG